MATPKLAQEDWQTISTALQWYIDDRYENAKLSWDSEDQQVHWDAASEAEIILSRLDNTEGARWRKWLNPLLGLVGRR